MNPRTKPELTSLISAKGAGSGYGAGVKIKAQLNNLRIAPRKVRLVADMVRGKSAEHAHDILSFTPKRAVKPILKLLDSALANAKNNLKLDTANLFISSIEVNEGSKLKRMMPRARGQGYEIQKKTSHVIMVLEEREKSKIPPQRGEARSIKLSGKKHES